MQINDPQLIEGFRFVPDLPSAIESLFTSDNMELIKNAIREVVLWAGAKSPEPLRGDIVAERAEKIAIYNTLLNQYWTWKLEIVKHAVVFNGLGLAATATVAVSSRAGSDFHSELAFVFFVVGLLSGAISMAHGAQVIQNHRAAQVDALQKHDGVHPEMAALKIRRSLEWVLTLSFACFAIGAMLLFVGLS